MDWIDVPVPPEGVTRIMDAESRVWEYDGARWHHSSRSGNTLIANNFALLLGYYGPLRIVPENPVCIPASRLNHYALLKVYSEARSQVESTADSIVQALLTYIKDGEWPK